MKKTIVVLAALLMLFAGAQQAQAVNFWVEYGAVFEPNDVPFTIGWMEGDFQFFAEMKNSSGKVTGYVSLADPRPSPEVLPGGGYTDSFGFDLDINPGEVINIFASFEGWAGAIDPKDNGYPVYAFDQGVTSVADDPGKAPLAFAGAVSLADPRPSPRTLPLFGFTSPGVGVGGLTITMAPVPEPLTLISVPGSIWTWADRINDSGTIAGSYMDDTGAMYGYTYDGSTYTSLSVPGAEATFAPGINNSNVVTGYYWNPGSYDFHAYIYNGSEYTLLDVPGASSTIAYGINEAGHVVGSSYTGNQWLATTAYIYDGADYTSLVFPGAVGTHALDINNKGDVVGAYYDGTTYHGYLFDGRTGAYTTIDVAGAADTYAYGINNSGDIVGYYVDGTGVWYGFLYDGSAYTTFDFGDDTYGEYTYASGINSRGDIVGGIGDPGTGIWIGYFLQRPPQCRNPQSSCF
ncbi:MAG: hypothetical protein V3R54_01865 [Thermodesulfovibrionia bacterium]